MTPTVSDFSGASVLIDFVSREDLLTFYLFTDSFWT